MSSDALSNPVAVHIVAALADRGIRLSVRRGMLAATRAQELTDEDRATLRQYKAAVMVLVLLGDARTRERLAARQAGRGLLEPAAAGHCHTCGERLPRRRPLGRCGWCALAARLEAGGPIPEDVLTLFDPAIVGPQPVTPEGLDLAVPA